MHDLTAGPADHADPVLGGAGIDGSAYLDVVHTAQHAPVWLDRLISGYSTYGLALSAGLMLLGWWHARRHDQERAVQALAVPLITLGALAVSSVLKLVVREDRPCQSLHVVTLEACPAPGDWSFPSNHATLAVAAAVALWFVSRRLGLAATAVALTMAASRVWVGAHYPHDIAAGLADGVVVAAPLSLLIRTYAPALSGVLGQGPLRRLVAS
ncbi:phosphatase PAP2 family protein [Streptomyces sp. NPDC056661]|uniref:phosphatase PAP2 family protein n=1 Tax=Streptomyces sp. NPDC056661 TaxID=3345898 RepID=UPI0036743AA3